jgi:FkbM family methyltransferase
MLIKSFTQVGTLALLEAYIRSNIYLYIVFRNLSRFFTIFENDFNYLISFFKNRKINIIDIGASDGISVKFFLKKLNVKKIYCYEPHNEYLKKLHELKKTKNYLKKIYILKYGLSKKSEKKKIFYPILKVYNKTIPILSYTFYSKEILRKQMNLDFKKKLKIKSSFIYLKKFELIKNKIDFIKIDTNGYEFEIIKSILPQIKKDKPILVVENNKNQNKIYNILKKNYKKYYYINKNLRIHKKEKCINIFYVPKSICIQ